MTLSLGQVHLFKKIVLHSTYIWPSPKNHISFSDCSLTMRQKVGCRSAHTFTNHSITKNSLTKRTALAILYSWKLSWVKTFANFAIQQLSVKVLSEITRESRACGPGFHERFTCKMLYIDQFAKIFTHKCFQLYGISTDVVCPVPLTKAHTY